MGYFGKGKNPLTSRKEKETHTFSLRLTSGDGYCHKNKRQVWKQTKGCYESKACYTNVFASNIQNYVNHHLKHKFSESYKYLAKTQSSFSLKSFLGTDGG